MDARQSALACIGLLTTLALSGCLTLPSVDRPAAEASPPASPGARSQDGATKSHGGISSQAAIDLILAASQSVRSMTGFSGYSGLEAIYVGSRDGCDAITVHNEDFNQTDHYLVCQGRIERRNDVAPAPPGIGGVDARARNAARLQAYEQGDSIVPYQGYRYRATRVGPSDGSGCAIVEVMVSFDGLLVDRETSQVCPAQ